MFRRDTGQRVQPLGPDGLWLNAEKPGDDAKSTGRIFALEGWPAKFRPYWRIRARLGQSGFSADNVVFFDDRGDADRHLAVLSPLDTYDAAVSANIDFRAAGDFSR